MAEEHKKEFKGRLRIAEREMDGSLILPKALARIKGIGTNLAESLADIVSEQLHVDKKEKIGYFSDEQLKKLEEIVSNPLKYGIPAWMVNRVKDPDAGENKHLLSSALEFQEKLDKKSQIDIKSYKGVRHMFGLPVRGQRTKTMGRKGLSVGVTRKKLKPGTAKKGEKKKKGKK